MSDFWRSLDFSLIKSKIKLDLSFPKILRTDEVPANLANNPAYDRVPPTEATGTTFQTSSAK